MPEFQGLPRAALVAISRVSGDTYREIEGAELVAELARMGHEPEGPALVNLMFQLKDAGYMDFAAVGGMDPANLDLIRLGERGRQEVEGWPKASGVSAADVEALIRSFEEYANDPHVPEQQRRRAGAIASAGRDLGIDVAGSVIASWLRAIGIA
jgi:hypothetical protein